LTKRKRTEGFNLAFLDIMSCGLGAIILVFMLVKHNINDSSVELDNLKNDINHLEELKQKSLKNLKSVEAQLAEYTSQETIAKKNHAQMQVILAKKSQNVTATARELDALKSEIKSIKVVKKADLIESKQVNEENYILGLKVEGRKIALLVDASASMTHEKLINIIKTKNGSNRDKQRAKKWIRTKKVVKWLLARLGQNSEFIVVAFNEKAKVLGKKGWVKANASTSVSAILSDLNRVVPEGATNLHLGLQTVNKFSPSNLYIITDGLPTKGGSSHSSLNIFSGCSSLLGNSKIISGACRVKLFRQTISDNKRKNVQIDVVLLPLEGDPDAINQYWSWTASTGGLVISPANNWP